MKQNTMMKKNPIAGAKWVIAAAVCAPFPAYAQLVVSDTLTGPTTAFKWQASGGACLTAGRAGVGGRPAATSTVPACQGKAEYSGQTMVGGTGGRFPDNDGEGALRLTNGANGTNMTGSVVSTEPFPTTQGVQVTFSTVTYGGNGYKNSDKKESGADGLAFFLMDGSKLPKEKDAKIPLGAFGGSLGYSCSNGKGSDILPYAADGLNGAFVGVAIDEFGNFSNAGDNTATGPGQTPNTIMVRGAGNVSWAALNSNFGTYYPSWLPATERAAAVRNTCKTGKLWDYSRGSSSAYNTGRVAISSGSAAATLYDYKPLVDAPLPVTGNIYNQENDAGAKRELANLLTYSLTITQDNLLSLTYNINGGDSIPVITNKSVATGNGPLPPSFLFGFVSGTGGGSNVHEIVCFKAATINSASNSAGANAQQSAKVITGTQVYLSYYHPLNSWGQLVATNLTVDTSNIVRVNGKANWDANCVLTGGNCAAISSGSTPTSLTAQAPSDRVVLSYTPASTGAVPTVAHGIAFDYANMTEAQRTAMGTSETEAKNRIAYLRGDRTNELGNSGSNIFRKRDGILGDIRNSSPTWVGPPSFAYTLPGKDLSLASKPTIVEFGDKYTKFKSDSATRLNVVYNGANDGMLHGFRAGSFNASGAFSSTGNDGLEVIAYVPDLVARTIHSTKGALDFSSTQYAHNYYVDATPGTGDLYYKDQWHTWLVSGLGAGGNGGGANGDTVTDSTGAIVQATDTGAIFGLNITTPTATFGDNATFAQTNAAKLVIGEWNSDTLACSDDTRTSSCKVNFGSQYGTPIVRLLHDGNWAVIFGNGRNSANGGAGIYIMTVSRATGATSFRYIATSAAKTEAPKAKNGIDFVASADLDNDHVTDYVYAGDSSGNLWRFDLTSAAPGDWSASNMFQTPAGQPISARVTINSVPQTDGPPRLMVIFGTGRATPATLTSGSKYATGTQTMYGLWDWDLVSWNAKKSVQYAVISTDGVAKTTSDQLQSQTYFDAAPAATGGSDSAVSDIAGYRLTTANPVCWLGTSTCKTDNTQRGWKANLPITNEQLIYAPVVVSGVLFFNTYVPGVDVVLSCTSKSASGFTMGVNPETGAALPSSAFESVSISEGIDPTTGLPKGTSTTKTGIVVGIGLSATGSPSFVTADNSSSVASSNYMFSQTTGGNSVLKPVDLVGIVKGKRITWRKLR